MKRRKLLMMLIGVSPLSLAGVLAKDKANGKGKGKGNKQIPMGQERGPEVGSRVFRQEHYAVIERYYDGPRELPPGLRKKYYRTGTLPPGWQKKLRPFPPDLVRVLPPPPPNCGYGYIDGVAVVYDRTTRIILDSIDIISAIAGH